MYPLDFFKPNGKVKFDIAGCIGIMSQFDMIVEAILVTRKPKTQMPFQSFFFPVLVPFFLCAGTNKELHFHLLKLTHPENKLPRHNLITECFTDLRNPKRYLHSSRFL